MVKAVIYDIAQILPFRARFWEIFNNRLYVPELLKHTIFFCVYFSNFPKWKRNEHNRVDYFLRGLSTCYLCKY